MFSSKVNKFSTETRRVEPILLIRLLIHDPLNFGNLMFFVINALQIAAKEL